MIICLFKFSTAIEGNLKKSGPSPEIMLNVGYFEGLKGFSKLGNAVIQLYAACPRLINISSIVY